MSSSAPATAGTALVVSENYFPGWTATVDGKPARPRADYTSSASRCPPARRTIELDFADPRIEGQARDAPRDRCSRSALRCRRCLRGASPACRLKPSTERALVIVPTYNERENIARLIETVLAQDPRLEVLVVDDGSPDGTGADRRRDHAREPPRAHARSARGRWGWAPRTSPASAGRSSATTTSSSRWTPTSRTIPAHLPQFLARHRAGRSRARLALPRRARSRSSTGRSARLHPELLRERLRARCHRPAGLGRDRAASSAFAEKCWKRLI